MSPTAANETEMTRSPAFVGSERGSEDDVEDDVVIDSAASGVDVSVTAASGVGTVVPEDSDSSSAMAEAASRSGDEALRLAPGHDAAQALFRDDKFPTNMTEYDEWIFEYHTMPLLRFLRRTVVPLWIIFATVSTLSLGAGGGSPFSNTAESETGDDMAFLQVLQRAMDNCTYIPAKDAIFNGTSLLCNATEEVVIPGSCRTVDSSFGSSLENALSDRMVLFVLQLIMIVMPVVTYFLITIARQSYVVRRFIYDALIRRGVLLDFDDSLYEIETKPCCGCCCCCRCCERPSFSIVKRNALAGGIFVCMLVFTVCYSLAIYLYVRQSWRNSGLALVFGEYGPRHAEMPLVGVFFATSVIAGPIVIFTQFIVLLREYMELMRVEEGLVDLREIVSRAGDDLGVEFLKNLIVIGEVELAMAFQHIAHETFSPYGADSLGVFKWSSSRGSNDQAPRTQPGKGAGYIPRLVDYACGPRQYKAAAADLQPGRRKANFMVAWYAPRRPVNSWASVNKEDLSISYRWLPGKALSGNALACTSDYVELRFGVASAVLMYWLVLMMVIIAVIGVGLVSAPYSLVAAYSSARAAVLVYTPRYNFTASLVNGTNTNGC